MIRTILPVIRKTLSLSEVILVTKQCNDSTLYTNHALVKYDAAKIEVFNDLNFISFIFHVYEHI